MSAATADACTWCPLWRAVARTSTSPSEGMKEGGSAQLPPRPALSASAGPRSPNVSPILPPPDDLATLLTRRAGDDPAWWAVVRQYALGHARWPDPFQPRKPKPP